MARLFSWLKRTARSVAGGIRRFPLTILAATVIMIIGLILLHGRTGLTASGRDWLGRTAVTLGLFVPLSVASRLFLERWKSRCGWVSTGLWFLLALILALYMLFLLPSPVFSGMVPAVRYVGLMVAAIALVVAVPYFGRGSGDERFALSLLWRAAVTGAFTGVLDGGISLVLLMVNRLLGVPLWMDAYADVSILCFGLFAPSFFLAGVPASGRSPDQEPFQPLLRVLFGYIGFPLLSVYTVIMYAYAVRIAINASWPSNTLVNLVLWYTALGVLALYFMRSQTDGNRWFSFFDRWYPRLTLLPLALMFAGLFIRIVAYGFTEPRFFVLMLALWVSAITLIAIFRKPLVRPNIIAPALAAVLAVVAVLGPLSAFAVSGRSQLARLENVLKRNNMLTSELAVTPGNNVSEDDKRAVYAALDYFASRDGMKRVPFLGGLDYGDWANTLGFERPMLPNPNPDYYSFYISPNGPIGLIDTQGFDYVYFTDVAKGSDLPPENGFTAALVGNSVFTIWQNGKVIYEKDLFDYAHEYDAGHFEGQTYSATDLTKTDANESVTVKYIFTGISVSHERGVPSYYIGGFYALINIK
jgi:hypothetical protein